MQQLTVNRLAMLVEARSQSDRARERFSPQLCMLELCTATQTRARTYLRLEHLVVRDWIPRGEPCTQNTYCELMARLRVERVPNDWGDDIFVDRRTTI